MHWNIIIDPTIPILELQKLYTADLGAAPHSARVSAAAADNFYSPPAVGEANQDSPLLYI